MIALSRVLARLRSYWIGIVARARVEQEMAEEFQHHLALRTEELIRSGVPAEEASRRARVEFGHIETTKADARASRGVFTQSWVSTLDLKLGWRALRKYPLLNLVAGVAIAFAIAWAALVFEGVTQVLHPRLPLPEGDRVVGIRLWNAASSRSEQQLLYYYSSWREQLRSLSELGAFSEQLATISDSSSGRIARAPLAAITVSGFRIARVGPMLGRAFVEADGKPGAPAVVILGNRLWRQGFAADSGLVGRQVRIAGRLYQVIGIMPEGFSYPIQHQLWVPLQLTGAGAVPGKGPPLRMLGRLAPNVRLADAQKELSLLAARSAADVAAEYETVRPQVMPYAKSIVFVPTDASIGFRSANLATVLLLILACGNVALLVFARGVTRDSELVVRQALGASRSRIIAQLFGESLVLATIATAIGLGVAGFAMKWLFAFVQVAVIRPPFWFRDSLSVTTIAYGAVLAVLTAAMTGALPAARLTRDLGTQVRASGTGSGGIRLGRTLGFLMAAQVTVAVLFPVAAYSFRNEVMGYRSVDLGYPAGEYVGARLGVEASDSSVAAALLRALRGRVEGVPGVSAVTFASALPGMWHTRVRFEVDAGGKLLVDSLFRGGAAVARVDVNFFETMQARMRLGRGFKSSDLAAAVRPVVVSESFVTYRLKGRNPIGWRLRYSNPKDPSTRPGPGQERGPWMEIVGVVKDLAMTNGGQGAGPYPNAGFYEPMEPELQSPLHMAVRVRGSADTFGARLYGAASSIDPQQLRVDGVFAPSEVSRGEAVLPLTLLRLSLLLSAMALLISGAALYAVTSVIVRRRTQEIGVRIALGSDSRSVLGLILRRPFVLVASGVVAGTLMTLVFDIASPPVVLGYGGVMLVVCMVGCFAPAMRALRIAPMEALRTE